MSSVYTHRPRKQLSETDHRYNIAPDIVCFRENGNGYYIVLDTRPGLCHSGVCSHSHLVHHQTPASDVQEGYKVCSQLLLTIGPQLGFRELGDKISTQLTLAGHKIHL